MICSLGLHPWYLQDHERLFADLLRYAGLPNVLAIGECGLDKVCDTAWDTQTSVFRKQIELANDRGKPLIIHCVRAFDELLGIIREKPMKVPVVVHGFNKKRAIAEELVANRIYLSFGVSIMKNKAPAADVLKHIAGDKFFLETDDATTDISEIYQKAAETRETSGEAIILQVQQNFNNVFKSKV